MCVGGTAYCFQNNNSDFLHHMTRSLNKAFNEMGDGRIPNKIPTRHHSWRKKNAKKRRRERYKVQNQSIVVNAVSSQHVRNRKVWERKEFLRDLISRMTWHPPAAFCLPVPFSLSNYLLAFFVSFWWWSHFWMWDVHCGSCRHDLWWRKSAVSLTSLFNLRIEFPG